MDWEDAYQNQRTGWDRGEVNAALLHWLGERSLQPCRILIPGCGFGYEVCELAARGFDVTAIDIAPSATRRLRQSLEQRGLRATVIEGDLFAQSLPPFDAIYEQTCLCATEPEHWQAYAAWLHRHLHDHGRLFALFMQTGAEGGPPFHCALDVMADLFDDRHWQWPENSNHYRSPHHHGRFEHGVILGKRSVLP